MSWNPVINQADKFDHQMRLRDIYDKEVIIRGTPLLADDPIVYVQLISPERANEKAIGFNVFSNKDRKQTLLDAEASFQPKATPIIQLVQSKNKTPAYLMFFPVFKGNKELRGFATGVFLAEDMIIKALNINGIKRFDYELYENGKDEWFSSNNQGDSIRQLDYTETLNFMLTGQKWQLFLKSNEEYLLQQQSQSYQLLYSLQFVIVSFIILLILLMNTRQIELNSMVDDKTQSLENAVKEANEANLAKSRFLANMSHEIRTPMNAVIGFAGLARETNDIQVIQQYLEKIEISSDLLLNIVNDILDISKIEADKLVLSHENFDLHKSLDRVHGLFYSQAESKGLEFHLLNNIPSALFFKGDQVRFEQILVNLCSNALKFTKQGRITLSAEIRVINKEQNKITIRVKDTGIGISQENQEKLFSAFTQADESTSRRFGGTGLGLALSKELSLLMQGDIRVISEEGEGAEFIFESTLASADSEFDLQQTISKTNQKLEVSSNLPFAINSSAHGAEMKVKPDNAESENAESKLAGLHLLVAEDNEINQLVIEAILQNEGITADIVCNGKQAVRQIQQGKYDAVLMDCQMPVLDGYQATEQIRAIDAFKSMPIFALTADVTSESKERAAKVGFTGHLSKPIMLDELKAALETV
jgi:signal transduction histidine kinase